MDYFIAKKKSIIRAVVIKVRKIPTAEILR